MFKSPVPQSIEEYLAQIARELRSLPAQARADEMREIESHLRAMIEQRGDVAAAIEQFGAPRKVGRDLRRAWERKQPEAWWRLPMAIAIGLGFTQFAWFVYGLVATQGKSASISLLYSWSFVTIFIAGSVMGAASPKYSRWMGWVIYLSFFAESAYLMRPDFFKDIFGFINPVVFYGFMGIMLLIFNIPCFYGARIGARLSRKRDAKIADAK